MKVVVQRVSKASVHVDGQSLAQIGQGMLLLVGVQKGDTKEDADYLVRKISKLRIFEDETGKMNLDIAQIDGEVLSVSQFTLIARTKKGNRPSFDEAEIPKEAKNLYDYFNQELAKVLNKEVLTGKFGADMDVALHNDGPVTIVYDTRQK